MGHEYQNDEDGDEGVEEPMLVGPTALPRLHPCVLSPRNDP